MEMGRERVGRRLLSALAGSTPAFTSPPVRNRRSLGRRLLSALAGSTAAFTPQADCACTGQPDTAELRRQQDVAALATEKQLKEAGDTLARLVRQQWREEATARALGDPEPMPVRWQLASRSMMDYPQVIADGGALVFAGSSERIDLLAEAFRGLCRRRLVITGGSGTGKTTLAVQLLLDLLDLRFHAHPEDDAHLEHPVPVLFSLVDWIPDKQQLQDWLSERLRRDYPALRFFGLDAAAKLVERGRILPVLDGLDEVDAVRRARIITALNASLDYVPGLILTSRRDEFKSALADAEDVLAAAAVIGPFTLSNTEAASYLRRCLPPGLGDVWDPVLDRLEAGTAQNLAEVTATALGLWLVRTVYLDGHRDPNELIDKAAYPDYVTLRAHLLDELIPAVLQNRPPTPPRCVGPAAATGAALRPG